MELHGLKINCLGDSITQGVGASAPSHTYVARLKNEYDTEARNFGIGGSRIAAQNHRNPASTYDYTDFCTRARDLPADADLVLIMGGTNDYGHGDAPFGEETDRTPDTFRGACHVLFRTVRERFPGKPVVVVLPLPRDRQDTPSQCGHILADYVDEIAKIAGGFGFFVLDLFHGGPVVTTADGLHPDDAGHAVLAREIASLIEKLP